MKLSARLAAIAFALLSLVRDAQGADSTAPTLQFLYPTDGMVLTTNWQAIRGLVTDEPSGSGATSVTITILAPDGTFWNGSAYGANPVALATTLNDGTNWSRTTKIPIKNDLQWGDYVLFAEAVDAAGNRSDPISITVTMNVPPPPPNDDFASAELLSGNAGRVYASTSGATREAGEPLHAFVEGSASVWYKWVAPEPGFLTVDTLGSNIDTILGIYTGQSVSDLTLEDGNDDGGQLGASRVEISVAADTTYFIAVDGKFGASGPIVLGWEFSSLARPRLRVRLTNAPPSLVVSWPASAEGFSLYSAAEVVPPSGWNAIAATPEAAGDELRVTLPASGPRRFFRLQKP